MPYHEPSFLNGLVCGLTATNGRPLNAIGKTLLTGSSRVTAEYILNWPFDTFVSNIQIETDSPVTILYEYGPRDAATLTREIRRVPASEETQTVGHACRIPQAVPLRDFNYGAYLLERAGMRIRFDAKFMSFPYRSGGEPWLYPGTPEAVDMWWVRTIRR